MNPVNILIGGYTLILILGGLVGYLKAGSLLSIISSLVFGSLLLIGLYNKSTATLLLTLTALLLFFAYRWFQTGNFLPAGVLLVLTGLVLGASFLLLKRQTL